MPSKSNPASSVRAIRLHNANRLPKEMIFQQELLIRRL